MLKDSSLITALAHSIYHKKYLKYKSKYVELRDEMSGGAIKYAIFLLNNPNISYQLSEINKTITMGDLKKMSDDYTFIPSFYMKLGIRQNGMRYIKKNYRIKKSYWYLKIY